MLLGENEKDDVADDVSLCECGCDDYIVGDDNDGDRYNEDEARDENDEDNYDASPWRSVKYIKGGGENVLGGCTSVTVIWRGLYVTHIQLTVQIQFETLHFESKVDDGIM